MPATSGRSQGTNEWLQLYEFDIALGSVQQQLEAEAARAKQAALRETLEAQMAEHERMRKQDREQEEAYWRQEQATLRKADEDAEARRQLQAEIMVKLKDERLQQMEERVNRRVAAQTRRRAEEALDASRTAYDTHAELRQEEEARVAAKLALKELLQQNEVNKALREEAKKKQWDLDLGFQRTWTERLNKQESDRRKQMERIKEAQSKLQEAADRQGENRRRWLETPLVEKYFQQREDEKAAEEERRLFRSKEGAKHATVAVAEQLKEREAARLRLKQEEEAYAASLAARIRASEEAEQARKADVLQRKLKFKSDIEAQMRDSAQRRRAAAAPMSETERKINQRTLQQVASWQTTGRLPLPLLSSTTTSVATAP
ncbi:hypothetical protein TSOC_006202 [Tetrabaena socialis]|uniref:Trichohyalin-plectin-homology domain-containing protein n=1 Tax=Tetrabaena socialis TaxID=47790 RepID=A0A2J8A489_9CHLO|nr:hypothetical protein TSOC_006202 [Tetrabaena socialis]|eukprot:PNH07334.1 hypothetical protein TSOC_006202 [Tetrabaena socialis]